MTSCALTLAGAARLIDRLQVGDDRQHLLERLRVCCPFCAEDDFDLYGLKTHFNMGWCEPFEAITEADRLDAPTPALNREEADRA